MAKRKSEALQMSEGLVEVRLLDRVETMEPYSTTDDDGNPVVRSRKVTGNPGDIVQVSAKKAAQMLELGCATDDLDSPLEDLLPSDSPEDSREA